MARLALTFLIVALAATQAFGMDLRQSFAEFMFSTTYRTRTNAIFIKSKIMNITPAPLQPKVEAFFEWLLGMTPPHNPWATDSEAAPVATPGAVPRPPPARPRMTVDEVETMLAKDLDTVLADFKLKHDLADIVGKSKTVTGDHGSVRWFGSVQRTNGKTVFQPRDETTLGAEVGFEFNLNVTYEYHLRAAIDRDGHTTTLLRQQNAIFIATLERPYSSSECYIRDPWVNYPQVQGPIQTEVQAPPKFSMLGYQGGAISSTLFPQCRTDIETGIELRVPPAAAESMTKYLKEALGGKVC